jgi:hypothetical protein
VTALFLGAAACASGPPPQARRLGALEAAAMARSGAGRAPETSTSAYRALARNALGSRCRMFPTDSEVYDRRARRCGAVTAAVRGFSRVLLEVAATPEVLRPVVIDGRMRWLDLPPDGECAP